MVPIEEIPKKWDYEADLIVIGAGTAGMPAAITATDQGPTYACWRYYLL